MTTRLTARKECVPRSSPPGERKFPMPAMAIVLVEGGSVTSPETRLAFSLFNRTISTPITFSSAKAETHVANNAVTYSLLVIRKKVM